MARVQTGGSTTLALSATTTLYTPPAGQILRCYYFFGVPNASFASNRLVLLFDGNMVAHWISGTAAQWMWLSWNPIPALAAVNVQVQNLFTAAVVFDWGLIGDTR